jgi:hypothetical protein
MKTPEELEKIAEEYERSITPAIEDADNIFKHERIRSFQYGYRAGYQAAKDQLAKVGVPMDPVTEKEMAELFKEGPWVRFWTKKVRVR